MGYIFVEFVQIYFYLHDIDFLKIDTDTNTNNYIYLNLHDVDLLVGNCELAAEDSRATPPPTHCTGGAPHLWSGWRKLKTNTNTYANTNTNINTSINSPLSSNFSWLWLYLNPRRSWSWGEAGRSWMHCTSHKGRVPKNVVIFHDFYH